MRALTASELRAKLTKRAQNPADIENTLSKLSDYGYLDDARFAESFATARRDNQGFGKQRVLRDLKLRRVAGTVAEKAVGDAFAGTDETTMVKEFLERKYRNKDLSVFLQDPKNLASAFRRLRYAGFAAGPAIKVLKRFASDADALEDQEEPLPE
jgi:regulatory protein